jgi:F-type H+-transporting ATPase subunit b
MPQLVITDFTPQLAWLLVTFVALYVILSRLVLPRIGGALDDRENRLKGDLDRAERLRAEAEAALAEYQKAIGQARAAAQAELQKTAAGIAEEAARREAALGADINARTREAEASIASAKQAALADIRNVAGEAVRDLVGRLAGVQPEMSAVEAALQAAQREHA